MKPGAGKRKGSSFEREFCKELSLWWTGGKDKDVFWRTHSSGARHGISEESGDVMSVKDTGKELTKYVHIELKCVNDTDLLLDLIRPGKKSKLMEWFDKANKEAQSVGKEPLLVVKLSNRTTFCMFPSNTMWVDPDTEMNILLYRGVYIIVEWESFLKATTLKDRAYEKT